MRKEIKSINEMPDWFELDSYSNLSRIEPIEWLLQIGFRRYLNHISTGDWVHENIINKNFGLIKDSPVLSLSDLDKLPREWDMVMFCNVGFDISQYHPVERMKPKDLANTVFALDYQKDRDKVLEYIESHDHRYEEKIRELEIRLDSSKEDIELEQKLINETRIYVDEIGRKRNRKNLYWGYPEDEYWPKDFPNQAALLGKDWPEFKVAHYMDVNKVPMTINLEFTDSEILDDLKQQIKKLRKETIFKRGKKRLPNINHWIESKAIPYVDLLLWSRINNKSIRHSVLTRELFPYGEHDESYLRRVTIRHANEFLDRENTTLIHDLKMLISKTENSEC